jgi:hypothetical protein
MSDTMRARAAAEIDRDFEDYQRYLILLHRREERRELGHIKAGLQDHARDREIAELRHVRRLRLIEEKRDRMADAVRHQPKTLGYRLATLTKAGRAQHSAPLERLNERAARLQGRATRQFQAITERQSQAVQDERNFRARCLRRFRERNLEERQQHRQEHAAAREQQIEARTIDMRRAEAKRVLLHQFDLARQNGRGR